MNANAFLAKNKDPKDRSIARIIPIHFIPEKKVKENAKPFIEEEVILFYTKPVFRAKKFELF